MRASLRARHVILLAVSVITSLKNLSSTRPRPFGVSIVKMVPKIDYVIM